MNEMLLFTLPKDEWITIADTTLTEDAYVIEFPTDIDGNPYECKEVCAYIKFNGTFNASSYTTWISWMPNKTTYANACRLAFGTYFNGDNQCCYAEGKIKGGSVCVGRGFFNRNSSQIDRVSEMSVIRSFMFNLSNGVNVPAGTTIKVWGLKA